MPGRMSSLKIYLTKCKKSCSLKQAPCEPHTVFINLHVLPHWWVSLILWLCTHELFNPPIKIGWNSKLCNAENCVVKLQICCLEIVNNLQTQTAKKTSVLLLFSQPCHLLLLLWLKKIFSVFVFWLFMSSQVSYLCCLIVTKVTGILFALMFWFSMFSKVSFFSCLIVTWVTGIFLALLFWLFMLS